VEERGKGSKTGRKIGRGGKGGGGWEGRKDGEGTGRERGKGKEEGGEGSRRIGAGGEIEERGGRQEDEEVVEGRVDREAEGRGARLLFLVSGGFLGSPLRGGGVWKEQVPPWRDSAVRIRGPRDRKAGRCS